MLEDVAIIGPKGTIVRNKRSKEYTADRIIEPLDVWPTDHKALLVRYKLIVD